MAITVTTSDQLNLSVVLNDGNEIQLSSVQQNVSVSEASPINVTVSSSGPQGPPGTSGDGVPPVGGGDCWDLEDPINVTNLDTAIGNALGAYYPEGTTLEKILRDILEPDVIPTIENLKMGIAVNGAATTYYSSDKTYEWGTVVAVQRWKFTLDDSGEFFDETQKIKASGNVYPTQISFPIEDYLLYSDWHDLPADTQFPPEHINGIGNVILDYVDLPAYSKTFNNKLTLGYALSDGDIGTASSSVRNITFAKKNWLIASPVDLNSGDDIGGSLNNLISATGSVVMDEGLTTSKNFSLTTNSSATEEENYTYIAIPSLLSIDTNVGESIQVGAMNYAGSYIYQGQFSYQTNVGNNAKSSVRIYQSNQPQAYSPNSTLNIYAD